MKLTASQRRALDVSDEEWRVIYEALAQYAENQADYAPIAIEDGHPEEARKASVAMTVLERFDLVFVELAS